MKENPLSFHLNLNPEDFLPATDEEKQSQVIMRESVSFWKDGMRRLMKNKVAMVSAAVILIVMFFSFIVPSFYPYTYDYQIKGANNLKPMEYSAEEMARIEAGEDVFFLREFEAVAILYYIAAEQSGVGYVLFAQSVAEVCVYGQQGFPDA